MDSNYSISVIIPTYNSSKTIKRAIESVLNQTYITNYEILIIDDGSTDATPDIVGDIITRHPDSNLIFIKQPNKGAAAARNAGMERASNEWIAFLDSDDEWLPTKIERQIDCIKQNPSIDFIGTEKVGHVTHILGRKKIGLSKISLKEQFIKWYPPTPTYLFKRSIINEIGYMDDTLRYAEDSDFLLRVLSSYSCWFLAEPLVICDSGNPSFGFSGLSKDLKGMQIGQRRVIRRALRNGILSPIEFLLARLYAEIKYARRIIKTKIFHFKDRIISHK